MSNKMVTSIIGKSTSNIFHEFQNDLILTVFQVKFSDVYDKTDKMLISNTPICKYTPRQIKIIINQ